MKTESAKYSRNPEVTHAHTSTQEYRAHTYSHRHAYTHNTQTQEYASIHSKTPTTQRIEEFPHSYVLGLDCFANCHLG